MPCHSPLVGKLLSNAQFRTDRDKYFDYKLAKPDPDRVLMPCRKCGYCRCRHATEVSARIMNERHFFEEASFLTLTYDEKHILDCPIFEYKNPWVELFGPDPEFDDDLESFRGRSLVRKHIVDFNKRLRRYLDYHYNKKVKIYYCGEYGSKNGRPHFHLIVLGHDFSDNRKFYKYGKKGRQNPLYTSSVLDRIWNKGFTVIGDVTHQSVAYVARYPLKKLDSSLNTQCKRVGRVPEFFHFRSRKGAGYDYFNKYYREIYVHDKLIYKNVYGEIVKIPVPRYYDKLLAIKDPPLYEQVKRKRSKVKIVEVPYDRLPALKECFESRTSSLVRRLEMEQKLVI